ncbi:MAG: hypothetical protein H3C46_11250, partial [Ignavibacteria bacterium]|nr:hypothetical protein [Ignavibacteria bacterium]
MITNSQIPPYSPKPRSGVKDFFLTMFASMFGFILAQVALFLFLFGIILVLAASAGSGEVSVKSNSILKITMDQEIIDSQR